MKLTKQKLEQLIMEEYKSMSRRIFDKRREHPGGLVRAFGDQDQPINRPEFHDKLTTLAGSDFNQARELADSLGEPLDIKVDPSNMETFEIDSPFGNHLHSPEFQLHYDFLMDDRASSVEEEPDIGEIYEFAQERGLDPKETREKIMKSYEFFVQNKYIKHGRFDPDEEVKKVFPGAKLYESKK
tara:strand:- start:111 stop:662 length:552 start_codon:yes stop_codon:yes gene_type:complete